MVMRSKCLFLGQIALGGIFVLAIGGAETACRSPTEMTFLITTNEPCSSVKGTAISVGVLGAALDAKPPTATSTFCDDQTHLLGSLVVVPSGDSDAELGVRIVTGTTDDTDTCIQNDFKGGCIVARRAIHFIPHSPITVPVEMDSSCVGLVCDPSSTCYQGACVAVTVDCLAGSCDAGSTTTSSIPPTGSWKAMASTSLKGRVFSANIAMGASLFIWGGLEAGGVFAEDGAIYNSDNDSWTMLPASGAPSARAYAAIAVTASGGIIVWGGSRLTTAFNDGAVYANGAWTKMPDPPTGFAARERAASVFASDTNEMIIWGGDDPQNPRTFFNDGAAYNATTNTWRPLKQPSTISARSDASALYSGGSAMVVFGGLCGDSVVCGDFAIYRPSNDTWYGPYTPAVTPRAYPAAVEIGSTANVLFFGGGNGAVEFDDGIDITPHDQSSVPIASPGDVLNPAARQQMASWINGNVMYVWGGNNLTSDFGNGAAYDAVAKTWTPMSAVNAPSARSFPAAQFTGSKAIVWGGQAGVSPNITYKADGAVYTP
jgi:hypothetical protein